MNGDIQHETIVFVFMRKEIEINRYFSKKNNMNIN